MEYKTNLVKVEVAGAISVFNKMRAKFKYFQAMLVQKCNFSALKKVKILKKFIK